LLLGGLFPQGLIEAGERHGHALEVGVQPLVIRRRWVGAGGKGLGCMRNGTATGLLN
jgi:hypothetical protein